MDGLRARAAARIGQVMTDTVADIDVALDVAPPAEGERVAAHANGWPVMVTVADGQLHAVANRCPHAASPLHEGRVRRGAIMCPLHGARFELATGRCIGGPYPPLKLFAVRVEAGRVIVAVPADPPPPELRPVSPAG